MTPSYNIIILAKKNYYGMRESYSVANAKVAMLQQGQRYMQLRMYIQQSGYGSYIIRHWS